ncbi:hypothetical protein TMatcc_001917 [Talaromyces marneffei ATCC 18224]
MQVTIAIKAAKIEPILVTLNRDKSSVQDITSRLASSPPRARFKRIRSHHSHGNSRIASSPF